MKMKLKMLLLLVAGALALGAAADGLREDELIFETDVVVRESAEASCDLRTVFRIAKVKGTSVLKGLAYSARGWWMELPIDDPSRTAEITVVPGVFADGVFQPDPVPAVTVLADAVGEGTVGWKPTGVAKRVYRFTHTARVEGEIDETATYYGYLDFTQCVDAWATAQEIEAAVKGEITHAFSVVQDALWPWQPVERDVAGAGVMTDVELAAETPATIAFSVSGYGTLHYEYKLVGGMLAVRTDGTERETLPAAVDWQSRSVRLDSPGAHEVAFVHTAGGGETAALRNVRWEEGDGSWAQTESGASRVDLREGVRQLQQADELMPFAFSSTNWIGVAGCSETSKARVTVVQMTGTAADVREWTAEVPNTFAELVKGLGEGVVKWKPARKGVYKATFDVLNGNESVHHEEVWFDLRKARGLTGFMLILR